MSRWATLAAAAVLLAGVACTGQPSSTEGTTASGVGGAGTGGSGAAGGSGGASNSSSSSTGGTLDPVLDDDGLVVRYYLDEADSGQDVLQVLDSAPNPLDLTLHYVPLMEFTGEPGRRGIYFPDQGLDGRATTLVDGTKVHEMLNGGTQATLEVVLTAEAFHESASRLLHIGSGTQSGSLTLSARNKNRLGFFWQDYTNMGEFDVVLAPERVVLHGVLNSDATEESERAKVFYNGSPAVNTLPVWPGANQPIDITDGDFLGIGNREVGGRSINGIIHYAVLLRRVLIEGVQLAVGADGLGEVATPLAWLEADIFW